jgi:hypothetical protein
LFAIKKKHYLFQFFGNNDLIGIFIGQDLRNSGARKFVLVGIGQIGCTPFSIANQGTQGCVEKYNADALRYSLKLRSLVDQLNGINLDSKYIFVNSTAGSVDSSLGKYFNILINFISYYRLLIWVKYVFSPYKSIKFCFLVSIKIVTCFSHYKSFRYSVFSARYFLKLSKLFNYP